MKLLAHRGVWRKEEEKNSVSALEQALKMGVGIETDIRDYKGKLVISHNVADDKSVLVEDIFELYKKYGTNGCLALNVKADGLQTLVSELLKKYDITNYFLFDMSIPEMIVYDALDLQYFTRSSDVEKECVLYENAKGVWLDSFYHDDWLDLSVIRKHIQSGKKVCVVSPELHGRDKNQVWSMLYEVRGSNQVYLCTDLLKEASDFFKE